MKIQFLGCEIDVVAETKEINIIQLFNALYLNFEFEETRFFNYFLDVHRITNGMSSFELAIKFCEKNGSKFFAETLKNKLNEIV